MNSFPSNANNPYTASGVDTEKGDALVDWLESKRNHSSERGKVISGIGGFAALFKPDL